MLFWHLEMFFAQTEMNIVLINCIFLSQSRRSNSNRRFFYLNARRSQTKCLSLDILINHSVWVAKFPNIHANYHFEIQMENYRRHSTTKIIHSRQYLWIMKKKLLFSISEIQTHWVEEQTNMKNLEKWYAAKLEIVIE